MHPLPRAPDRPRERSRLTEIIHNLTERIAEAKLNGWQGEIAALQVSFRAPKQSS
jgi:hypothetical protein